MQYVVYTAQVLVLSPTRELAAQTHSMIQRLCRFTDITSCLIVGMPAAMYY
jgi:ATP-dependent RNA helicase DDX27